jgi:hypothetical protein
MDRGEADERVEVCFTTRSLTLTRIHLLSIPSH